MPRPKKQINELTPGLPEKPGGLSESASRNWDRLITEMEDSGITLIPGFRAAIAQAAVLQADLETAWTPLSKRMDAITANSGARKLNPAVADMHTSREKLMRVLYQLGLTPKSIGGNAGKEKDEGPTLEELLKG